jgi:hypothetical protein
MLFFFSPKVWFEVEETDAFPENPFFSKNASFHFFSLRSTVHGGAL